MDWTDEIIERLKSLWSEGLSTAEIGRRMGISKNAVVGKAHRLALPPRPSPIRRGGPGDAPRRTAPRRVVGPTLPPLNAPVTEPAPVAPRAAPSAPPLRAVTRTPGSGRLVTCCWPIGEPGTRSFRFCDSSAVSGKPYCEEHAALAYVKVRDKREEAA